MRRPVAVGMTCVLGILTSAAVIALMTYRAVMHSGGNALIVLDAVGWGITVAGVAGLAMSTALLVHSRYLFSSLPAAAQAEAPAAGPVSRPGDEHIETSEPTSDHDLSRLPEDERRLYERIEEAGGEVLQMNLVASGEFSKSKVTRLLDRLESRGLIVRERKGMTNRVKLIR